MFVCDPELIVPFNISRPPIIRVSDKVMIPQDDHPDINFVGLLIGPRGNTLKCKFSVAILHLQKFDARCRSGKFLRSSIAAKQMFRLLGKCG